jgi:large subunit ribosomal protein L17
MKHRHSFQKLNRHAAHRHAMLSNMANSLLRHSRITTTVVKAKEVRRVVERLVTQARDNTLASRRQVLRVLRRTDNLKKLFDVIAPAFATRPGGYTRIIRLGNRRLDNADMACLEFVQDFAPVVRETADKTSAKTAAPSKAEKKPAKEKPAKPEKPGKKSPKK